MSFRAMAWAVDQDCPSAQAKLVLLILASYADDKGFCWPAQKTLAADCGMSYGSLRRHRRALLEAGLVQSTERTSKNGAQTASGCQLLIHGQAPCPPVDTPLSTGDTPPCPPVDTPLLEPVIEPSEGSASNEASPSRPRDEIWDELVETFGPVAERTNAHAKRNRAVADLKRHGATVQAVRAAVRAWPRRFESAVLTDMALATHYPLLAPRAHAPPPCPQCGIGGGMHAADCPTANGGET